MWVSFGIVGSAARIFLEAAEPPGAGPPSI
jgi:hypothetical protein